MRKLAVLMVGLFLATTLVAQDATKGKAKIEGSSLSVYRGLDNKKFQYGGSPSTMLQLMVTYPDKQLLRVDPSSKVTEFKDDKGTALGYTGFFKTTFSPSGVSKDREIMLVSVSGNVAPARGATKITVKGDLVLAYGLDEKSTEEKALPLKAKAEEKIGDFTVKCDQEKASFGDGGGSFSITSPHAVKIALVKDGEGKELELSSHNSYYQPFDKTWRFYFTLKKQTTKAKITIKYFAKEEKTTVPVDVSLGLGL